MGNRGQFDVTALDAGWFDATAVSVGWFDHELLATALATIFRCTRSGSRARFMALFSLVLITYCNVP